MTIPDPHDDDIVADLRLGLPIEAPEADAVEQRTPAEEAAPGAGGPPGPEVDEGDLAESSREVPFDLEDERDGG